MLNCLYRLVTPLFISDEIELSLSEEEFETAYEIAKNQYQRGPEVHFACALLQHYVCSMKANHPEDAVKARDELFEIIHTKTNTTGIEALDYAGWNQEEDNFFEAFIFYQVALELIQNNAGDEVEEKVSLLERCCKGSFEIICKLAKDDSIPNQLIKSYMIPFMKKTVALFDRLELENQAFLIQCCCLHYTEQCELAVEDYESRESTLNKVLEVFREKLGPNPERYHLYGNLLNNLGNNILLQNNEGGQAAKIFAKAIVAMKQAEDYDSADKKTEDLKKAELGMQTARTLQRAHK